MFYEIVAHTCGICSKKKKMSKTLNKTKIILSVKSICYCVKAFLYVYHSDASTSIIQVQTTTVTVQRRIDRIYSWSCAISRIPTAHIQPV